MALVVLSVVEQRLDAVRAVLAGASVVEVASAAGVSRSSVHRWMARYLTDQLAGLSDRSHRPVSCPHQTVPVMEVAIAELRRAHPRWGSKRIRMELLRKPVAGVLAPSERTIDRVLVRQGLLRSRPRKRPRSSYRRWERPGPMQLWGMDIVGGLMLVNEVTGQLREAKVVTAVDDHSRFCVIAQVVERATSRAVCLAFTQALARFGVPEEVLTDNGKQFTDRFGKRGEVLFDKICRKNGIMHRLTAPATPSQNGKVERFHGTFRPEFLDQAGPFTSVELAQAAVDAWVDQYNTDRPHQALDETSPVTPADRFAPVPDSQREVIAIWTPSSLQSVTTAPDQPTPSTAPELDPVPTGAVEFDRAVPASGNLQVAGKQFWLGPVRAGQIVRFWADTDLIHLSIAGVRIKTLRSHLSVNDLGKLSAQGAVAAGAAPLPTPDASGAVEVDRTVSTAGTVSLAGRAVLIAEILAGRRVTIRIEPAVLMAFDPESRELLRTRPNPLSDKEAQALRGARPAGPPPRPSIEPVRVQRRASNTGVIMVCGQKIALGRAHRHQTVTVTVSETVLAIELEDGEVRTIRRTTTQPVRSIKGQRPRTATVS